MLVYLMRHGIAEEAGPVQSDADRALTARGVEKLEMQARALRGLAWPVEKVLTSPLVRARQTAGIVAAAFGLAPVVEARLALGASPQDYLAAARDAGADGVLLVGHQPDIERALYAFTRAHARVRKGTIALVEMRGMRAGGGRLRAVHDPDEMAAAGRALAHPNSPHP